MTSWKWIAVLLLGAALAVGCGGDDDDDAKDSDKGKAGAGDEGEAGDDESHIIEVPEGAVACGTNVCEMPEGATAAPCCFDMFAGECGMMGGMSCTKLIEQDPRCPGIQAGPLSFASCCTGDNMCGLNTEMFGGSPCTELGEFAEMAAMRAPMGGMGFLMIPAPKACDE